MIIALLSGTSFIGVAYASSLCSLCANCGVFFKVWSISVNSNGTALRGNANRSRILMFRLWAIWDVFEKRSLLLSIDVTLFLLLQVLFFLMVSNVIVLLLLMGSKNYTVFPGWSMSLINFPISFIPLILASNMLSAVYSLTIKPVEIEASGILLNGRMKTFIKISTVTWTSFLSLVILDEFKSLWLYLCLL